MSNSLHHSRIFQPVMELIDEPFLADQIRVELAHQQAMCKALWSMRQDGTLCDITMHVEGCALRSACTVWK